MPAMTAANPMSNDRVERATSAGPTVIEIAAAVNTQGASGATTPRKRGAAAARTRSRCSTRVDRSARTVSGDAQTSGTATAITTKCARYGVTSGSGAYCAIRPATSGPNPKPADSAMAARRAPACASAWSSYGATDSSFTQAEPGAKIAPLAIPARNRPPNSSGVECSPDINTAVAAIDSSTAGRPRARRPYRSDSGPPTSNAGTRPRAYTPNNASAVLAETPACVR